MKGAEKPLNGAIELSLEKTLFFLSLSSSLPLSLSLVSFKPVISTPEKGERGGVGEGERKSLPGSGAGRPGAASPARPALCMQQLGGSQPVKLPRNFFLFSRLVAAGNFAEVTRNGASAPRRSPAERGGPGKLAPPPPCP